MITSPQWDDVNWLSREKNPVETRMLTMVRTIVNTVRLPMDQSIAWTNVSEYLGLDG
jgi:hypothetical protein